MRNLRSVLDNQERQEASFPVASQVIARSANDPEYPTHKKSIRPHWNNDLVAGVVKELLELEGWSVEIATNGVTAMKQLNGSARFDLLLLDNEMPGVRGVELVRAVRQLEHRRRTPIIMFSASDIKPEAEYAGVDAFLRKPEGLAALAETIERLLNAADRR